MLVIAKTKDKTEEIPISLNCFVSCYIRPKTKEIFEYLIEPTDSFYYIPDENINELVLTEYSDILWDSLPEHIMGGVWKIGFIIAVSYSVDYWGEHDVDFDINHIFSTKASSISDLKAGVKSWL